ncbi:MAG: nucleotidyltransferase domain-containing protein, partial [Thermoplasmata archaeon]|nr:nucleotidyltransferase domain-containing protein [Thermoplasmata archaeon]
MLENIIGTKSKIKILREMIQTEDREYCLEDLVKATNQSFGTVHPSLKGLVDSRIVLVRKIGRSRIYRLNKRHILYQRIRDLLIEEKTKLAKIAKQFSDRLEKSVIKNVILYGSVARGDFQEKSDVDILIIYARTKPEDEVLEEVEALFDEYDVVIVPVFLSVSETSKRLKQSDEFILNVLKD